MAVIYVLDANVFIEAANRHYAFDLAPAFWRALLRHAAAGRVCSIDRVKHELVHGNDELAKWAKDKFHGWFAATDQSDVIGVYREIMAWVQRQGQFLDGAKAEFAKGADGWLIAYAKVHGCIVVTHERFIPDAKKRVPIPNVCRAFGVLTIDTFDMLRRLEVRLG